MGQRLVISIGHRIDNGDFKILANAYYHWGGFTSTALDYAKNIYDNWKINYKNEINYFSDRKKLEAAVSLLTLTGAGITEDAKNYLKFQGILIDYAPCINRNHGLIEVSEDLIKGNLNASEGDLYFNIETGYIEKFTVFSTIDVDDLYYQWDSLETAKKAIKQYIRIAPLDFEHFYSEDIDYFRDFYLDHEDSLFIKPGSGEEYIYTIQ